jgi:formylmethanofuran dehydrogenase subunit E
MKKKKKTKNQRNNDRPNLFSVHLVKQKTINKLQKSTKKCQDYQRDPKKHDKEWRICDHCERRRWGEQEANQ